MLTPDDLTTNPNTPDTPDTDHYPMPPSPNAEPFIPAPTIHITAPNTPRERAYTLHIQGYRSPAIAAHLGVPERTIRHWIQTTNQDLNALPALDALDVLDTLDPTNPDQQTPASSDPNAPTSATSTLATLQHQRTLAVERHRARSAAAWGLHDQFRATLDPFLARLSERLLLHTQYPDDNDNVSMSTLELAGGPLSPAFRAMYHMLPGLINGITRSLALAERADLQIDRLLALTLPASLPQPATPPAQQEPKKAAKAAQHDAKPWPTREEINRAVEEQKAAERAAEDAFMIPRLTEHQRQLIRAYSALPDPLPDDFDFDNLKVDPNAPLTRWREVLFPHGINYAYSHAYDDDDDFEDDLDTTPPTGKKSGKHSGKKIGSPSGKHSGNPTAPTRHTPRRKAPSLQWMRARG